MPALMSDRMPLLPVSSIDLAPSGSATRPRSIRSWNGDRVAAFGVYHGTYKATEKSMTASFAHLYEVRGGKIASMVQYVDSHMVSEALRAD